MTLLTVIGLLGVVLVIIAYGLLAAGKLSADSNRYQWLNIIGTVGILLSLIGQWNLPAFLTNAAWILVGIVALVRQHQRRRG